MVIVMIPFDSGFLDRAVHAFDLTSTGCSSKIRLLERQAGSAIRPGMRDLSQSVFDAIFPAVQVENVGHGSSRWSIRVAWRENELNAVVSQYRVNLVRDSLDQGFEKSRGRDVIVLSHQLHEDEFARPVNDDIEVEFAFSGLDPSDVDVTLRAARSSEFADGIGLELLPDRLVAFDFGQAGDAMALQIAMQG